MSKLTFNGTDEALFKQQVQSCVEAVEQAGFILPDVEFSACSPVGDLSTVVHLTSGPKVISAVFDVESLDEGCDVVLCYQNELNASLTAESGVSLISVAVNDGDVLTDKIRLADGLSADLHTFNLQWNHEATIRHYCWFVVSLCLEFTPEDAAIIANAAVKQYQDVSRETWPANAHTFPQLAQAATSQVSPPFKLIPHNIGLYPVVDSVEWIEILLKRGVKTLQLRMKDPRDTDLEAKIKHAIELGREYKAQLFINDHWQLAIKYSAYGIHLGQEDIEVADLQAINQAGLRLGISTHGYYEILRAKQLQPSYIALGHIFPTTTKQMPSQPQGLHKLTGYQMLIGDDFPTVAIGGIDLNNAAQVWQTGVSSLAVVRAITQANDIQLAIDSFYQIMASPRSQKAIA
ncbi:MAG: thiamine phosphate synthase [Vibrio litoralis]|uniref:thiamine phosphate synthase n=1 Tax=Vibrio litoralis TaxID=335972 RepID=UPI003F9717F6